MDLFERTLKQSFKQIRESRALQLVQSTEVKYRRTIEDMYIDIKDLDRQAENLLLDLCPSSTVTTQVGPSDYKPELFVEKDLKIALDRKEKIFEFEIAVDRYEELFGPYAQADQVREVIPTWKSKIPSEEPKNQ